MKLGCKTEKELPLLGEKPGSIPVNFKYLNEVPALD